MAFHPYPQLIRGILKFHRFGLSHCFTNASTWSWVDHHCFGCNCCDDAILDSLSLCVLRMDYAATTANSQTHYAKGRPSPQSGFDTLTACGCRNYFTPLTAVLFTFPSRYCFTIGHCLCLALRHGRRGFVRNFTWIVLLRISICFLLSPATSLSLTMGHLSRCFTKPGRQQCLDPTTPDKSGLGWSAFVRHYLRNRIRFLQRVLRCFTSPRYSRVSRTLLHKGDGLSHKEILTSKRCAAQ